MSLQGPHQVAQKSTSTGFSDCRASNLCQQLNKAWLEGQQPDTKPARVQVPKHGRNLRAPRHTPPAEPPA